MKKVELLEKIEILQKEKDELDKTYLKEIFKLIEEERRNKSGEKRVARKV